MKDYSLDIGQRTRQSGAGMAVKRIDRASMEIPEAEMPVGEDKEQVTFQFYCGIPERWHSEGYLSKLSKSR